MVRPRKSVKLCFAVTAVVALTLLHSGSARTLQGPSTGLLVGELIDAHTAKPVINGIVTLERAQPSDSFPTWPREAEREIAIGRRQILTNSDGRFVFPDIGTGQYFLRATAPGYIPATYGQVRTLRFGPPIKIAPGTITKATFRVTKYSAVAGVLTDDEQDPLVNVRVACYRQVRNGERSGLELAGSSTTDDRGFYRVGDLVPGSYLCGSLIRTVTSSLAAAPTTRDAPRGGGDFVLEGRDTAYVRIGGHMVHQEVNGASVPLPRQHDSANLSVLSSVFFPAAGGVDDASFIVLGPAARRDDIRLIAKTVAGARISGSVTPRLSSRSVMLYLRLAGSQHLLDPIQEAIATTQVDPSGDFSFWGVPPGAYVLSARPISGTSNGNGTGPILGKQVRETWSDLSVSVPRTDLSNVSVQLRPALGVSGRFEFVGALSRPLPEQARNLKVRLQPTDQLRTMSNVVEFASGEGEFNSSGYPAGEYLATVVPSTIPPGWSLQEITFRGRDISAEPFALENDLLDVVAVLTDRPTRVTGQVAMGSSAACEVVIFPADISMWQEHGVVSRRWRELLVGSNGSFTTDGLAQGDYLAIALPMGFDEDPRDPAVLARLTPDGKRLAVRSGENIAIDLSVRGAQKSAGREK
jgi:hypothetical protein